MRRVFGLPTVLVAAFLVAVPVVSLVLGFGPYAIVAASAVGSLLVLLVEALLWRETGRVPAQPPARPPRPRPARAPPPGRPGRPSRAGRSPPPRHRGRNPSRSRSRSRSRNGNLSRNPSRSLSR